jgi:hypothetical protein
MNPETISKVMAHLGKKGGAKGGKSTSKKKREAVKKNLEKARLNRWPKRKGVKK